MDNLCEQQNHQQLITHKRPLAVFLEESGRLGTGYCATVSLSLFSFKQCIISASAG
jgi:hypothetical protein